MVVVLDFFRRGFDDFDRPSLMMSAKSLFNRGEGGGRRRVFEPDDEQFLHKSGGMIIPVKARDDFHRLVGAVGDMIQIQVVRRNQFAAQQMFADLFVPGFPVGAAGPVHQHERHELALAGLHEGDRLVALVQRAEPAGEQHDGVRMPDEHEFAGEKIFERDELFVLGDDRIGALLPRQADVDAETVFRPGAFVSGLHDARPGAGDDHETGLRNFAPELDGLLIFHLVRLRPRGTKNRDLADVRIRREQPEGVAQFAQRGLDDTHVTGVLHIGQQLERVFDDVGDFGFVVAAAFEFDEFPDPPLQFRVGGRFFAVVLFTLRG